MLKKIYIKNTNYIFKKINQESILIPLKKEKGEKEKIHFLNATATFIWKQINGVNSVNTILENLIAEFDITESNAQKDLAYFLNQLEISKLILSLN